MTFQLTRKFLQGEIDSSKVALEKHKEGVRIHELVIEAFEKEMKKLPKEKEEVDNASVCTDEGNSKCDQTMGE